MRTSDSPRSWSTTVSPQFKSASEPGSNSLSSVSIVKPTRRRTILEVVIRVKRRPAYHATGICLGDDSEDQALTRGQAMKEARSGDEEEAQDYEGDVDGDADVERNEDGHMGYSASDANFRIEQDYSGVVLDLATNERHQSRTKGGHAAQSSGSEIIAIHRAESMDLDSDSPSSCVTSSSSASENDDLCSIDEADLTDNLELDRDEDESDSGRVSHVSCSVDESDDDDEVELKRFRSLAPSPPVLAPSPIVQGISSNVQPPVNVLGSPRSPAVRTLDNSIKVEGAESKDVINGIMSSQVQTSASQRIISPPRSSPMSPLPIPMLSNQQTVDAPKIARKYPRFRLEVSLPHPSSGKRTLSQKGAATRADEEDSQPSQLNIGKELLEKRWNDGWPGQWDAEEGVGAASSLTSAVEGLRLDTRRPPSNVDLEIFDIPPPHPSTSQGQLRNHEGSEKGEMAGPCMEMELEVELEVGVIGCRALPFTSTLSMLQHDQHPTPIAKTVDVSEYYERSAPIPPSSSSIMPTFSSLRTESACAIETIACPPDLSTPTPINLFHQKSGMDGRNEFGRALKRKAGSLTENDEDDDGERQEFGNGLNHASSLAQPVRSDQALSRPGFGMKERGLDRSEQDQTQCEAESNGRTGALQEVDAVDAEDEDSETDVKNEGIKMENEDIKTEDETFIKWKGKGKEIAGTAGDSSSIDGRSSSSALGVEIEARELATRPITKEGGFQSDEKSNRPFALSTPTRIVAPTIPPRTSRTPRDTSAEDTQGSGNASIRDRVQAGSSTTVPKTVELRLATTSRSNGPPQVAPPQPGIVPIDKVLAESDYDVRGRRKPEPLRRNQRNRKASDHVLAFPPRAVVGYAPTLEEVDNIYLHLQLAPLATWKSPSNKIDGAFHHGDDLWNRVLHPNMQRILRDHAVQYPIPDIAPAYPPEADFIKFQFDKWGAQARVASYKACILGGSDSDNLAMKYLLDQKFGRNLSSGYSSPLIQVLASKLDAFGRLGMVDGVSPCRILSTSCLGRGDRAGVITREFGEFLTFCSTTRSTEVMAGWFDCQGKISTYSYTFDNRSLRVYTTGGGVDPTFQTYVQVILDCFTIILDLPPFDIDLELLHFAPLAIPKEEGPIAIVILELLVSGKVPHLCLLDMEMTEDRLEVWIPSIRLQHAQYLLDDHAAFKLLDTRLQTLRRMMDGCAQ